MAVTLAGKKVKGLSEDAVVLQRYAMWYPELQGGVLGRVCGECSHCSPDIENRLRAECNHCHPCGSIVPERPRKTW